MMNTLTKDKLVKEGDYWVIYRHSDGYGLCPIYKSKDKKQVEKLLT